MLRRLLLCLIAVALLLSWRITAWTDPTSAAKSSPYPNHRDLLVYADKSGELKPVKTVADWQHRRADILKGMEEAMGPLPSRDQLPSLDVKVSDEIKGPGFIRRTITFTPEKGDRLPADLYLPDPLPAGTKLPAMLALHPTGTLGKRIVAGEGPRTNRQYAMELAQRGYVVIAPDYPSFGDTQDYDFAGDAYISGTMKGIVNHMRCVDLLQSMPEVDPDRIGVIGHSLGGHNAMFVAVFDERLKVTVSSCGWTPFHDYYGGNIKGWTSDRYMPRLRDVYDLDPDKVPFDFYEVVAALAPRAFFSSSPVEDGNFDVAGVRKAIPRARSIYALYDATEKLVLETPLCDHDFPTETRVQAYRFIDSNLNHTPTTTVDFSAELPRIPALEPDQAMKSFQTLPGYAIEQTAHEPLVTDPVAMSFDEDGRLYVVEMRDYSELDQAVLGRIRLLEDTDNDGRFDKSTIFAEKLSWPTAILCYDGGVFVGAAPDVYYIKDTDGDLKADERKTVFTGFERSNVQGLINSFRWGLDNRIHGATSTSGGIVSRPDRPDQPAVNLRGRDFSFDPKTLDLRPESGGAQHGMSFDDWGRKFDCSNSNHAQAVLFDDRYLARNPFLAASGPRVSIAEDGGQAPVFRTSPVEPWRIVRTRLRASGQVVGVVEGGGKPAGYFTGATGITIYRGDAFPEQDRGLAIIGDVGSNIVHRKRIIPDGVGFKAVRIDEDKELLTSSDIWFRPVQFANAPDGCLHIMDMYREVIEHPKSLPPEIKQHLDLTSGTDRGRLYRLVPEGYKHRATPKLSQASTQELVALLNHTNAWHRDAAGRLLYEGQDKSAVPQLRKLIRESDSPLGRMHALHVLQGLSELSVDDVVAGLHDANPRVREHAVKLAEPFNDSPAIRTQLAEMTGDDDLRVIFQLAFTAGEFPMDWKVPVLTRIFREHGNDRWVRLAGMSSLADGAGRVLAALFDKGDFLSVPYSSAVMQDLATQIGRQNQAAEVDVIVQQVRQLAKADRPAALDMIVAVSLSHPLLHRRLATGETAGLLQDALTNARKQAVADDTPTANRAQAVRTLGLGNFETDGSTLLDLLEYRQPLPVQSEAISALSRFGTSEVASGLLARWKQLSPRMRQEAEEILFARKEWAMDYLTRVEKGEIPNADVSAARLQIEAKNAKSPLHDIATRLLKNSGSANRQAVIEAYRPALSLNGDVLRGREVFKKICAACHKLDGVGHEIGPNLATVRNRGNEAILLNVLDPNREVNPQYLNYVIVTEDGKSHTGIIKSETATSLQLMRAEAKTETILRQDIEVMQSSGLSIMPEGVEKQIDVQSMADLLAYLAVVN